MNKTLPLILGIVAAAVLSFGIHLLMSERLQSVVSELMKGVAVAQPPYSTIINVAGLISALIPTAVLGLVIYETYDILPGNSPVTKGFVAGVIALLLKGQLLRLPLMNVLVGNPVSVVALMELEPMLVSLSACIVLAYAVNWMESG